MLKTLALPQWLSQKNTAARPSVNYKAPRASLRKFTAINRFQLLASYVLAVSAGALLLAYLFGVNNYAAKGYEIKRLQTSLAQLNETNQKLNLQISEQSAIAVVQNDFDGTQFVPASQPQYLQMNRYTERTNPVSAN